MNINSKNSYKPEGSLILTKENRDYISSPAMLEKAMNAGIILESNALMCDSELNLHVELGGIDGIIPSSEAVFSPDGERTKDIAIISRVGKAVCFKVKEMVRRGGEPVAILSRKDAQKECSANFIEGLVCGDLIPAKVTHLENFGAFVDIGCGIISLLSVDSISVSRISHPRDRLYCGMQIYVAVKKIERDNHRIFVSQKELFGTWSENAALFSPGQTVSGIVRSVENYGIFVELTPNLAGLAELKENFLKAPPTPGQTAAVYIKSIIPERMKVKLVLIDSYPSDITPRNSNYFIDPTKVSHISRWVYSPSEAPKLIETNFEE